MREPSVIVNRSPYQKMILDMKQRVVEIQQRIAVAQVELQSAERDLYLLEKSGNLQSGSSES